MCIPDGVCISTAYSQIGRNGVHDMQLTLQQQVVQAVNLPLYYGGPQHTQPTFVSGYL
jgi:hypothetical protein